MLALRRPRPAAALAAGCLLALGAAGPASAAGSPTAQALGGAVVGGTQLGVAADGQAVVAWAGSITIFASVRPSGGVFGPRVKLSTGGTAGRDFALAVGRSGDAVVVWRRSRPGHRATAPLYMNVRRPGGAFGRAVRVPGSDGGFRPAVAMGRDGTILVAWRANVSRRCGSAVVAGIAGRGGPLRDPHRISGACTDATAVRAALSADGTGAVVWQGGHQRDAHVVDAVAVGPGGFGHPRRVSRTPVAGFGPEVSGGRTGALVVWRNRVGGGPAGAAGDVLVSTVTLRGTGAGTRLTQNAAAAGTPQIVARPDGSALVAWQEGRTPVRVLTASRTDDRSAFTAPVVADGCGALDASRTYAAPALDAAHRGTVVFQTACMPRFGLGPDYGVAIAQGTGPTAWAPATPLSAGSGYAGGSAVGAADDGEVVTSWVQSGPGGGVRAAVIAAPAAP